MVIVGNENVAVDRAGVIVVPISDVLPPALVEPTVLDGDGDVIGVASVPGVGQVPKAALIKPVGVLSEASEEAVDIALRATLCL